MITKISQSFVKDFRDYLAGRECGEIIRVKYVEEREVDDQEPGAKELGSYFEFTAFGTLPKSGKPPQAQYMASDPKKMTAPYRLATINAQLIKQFIDEYGFEIVYRGKKFDKGRFVGHVDLVLKATRELHFENTAVEYQHQDRGTIIVNDIHLMPGDHIVVDTKYSGLMSPTTPLFNKHGWKWSRVQKEYHGTQAIQYEILTGWPFFFWVTESSNKEGTESDMQIFHIPVFDWMRDRHIGEANDLFDKFQVMASVEGGLVPRPSFGKCNDCPLKKECKHKAMRPIPQTIILD